MACAESTAVFKTELTGFLSLCFSVAQTVTEYLPFNHVVAQSLLYHSLQS